MFGGHVFQQIVGIPIGTNCAPLLANLFLCFYENEVLDKLINSSTKLMVSHDLLHSAVTKQIAFYQRDLHSTPVFEHAMDCHC